MASFFAERSGNSAKERCRDEAYFDSDVQRDLKQWMISLTYSNLIENNVNKSFTNKDRGH